MKSNKSGKKQTNIFLGVDQTGAVDKKGRPRPLSSCLIRGREVSFFYLSKFSKKTIDETILRKKDECLFSCIDCVLGLPEALSLSWKDVLLRIPSDSVYGRKVAQQFFYDIGQGATPSRRVEIACKANSVFQEKPFQKNIQTGTYRFWKDIANSPKDFCFPALEHTKDPTQIPVFEGYPSLSWRLLFQSKTRNVSEISSLIKSKKFDLNWTKEHQKMVWKDPNLADAFVLALTMKIFLEDAKKIPPDPEGWILGVMKDSNCRTHTSASLKHQN